jgi:FixJ family two-component response regulator
VLTAFGDEEVHRRVEQAGFAAFLTKPWGLEQLQAAIQKAAANPLTDEAGTIEDRRRVSPTSTPPPAGGGYWPRRRGAAEN